MRRPVAPSAMLIPTGQRKKDCHDFVGKERGQIDTSVAALKESVAGSDYKLIRKRIDELNHATEHLAEVLMSAAVSTALEGREVAEV